MSEALQEFIEEQLDDSAFFRLVYHAPGSSKLQRVARAEVDDDTSAEEIAKKFKRRADVYADEAGEQLSFRAVAFKEDGELLEMFPFPAGDGDLFAATAEPERGVEKAAMRRTLQREKHIDKIAAAVEAALREDLKRARRRVEKLEESLDKQREANDKQRQKQLELTELLEKTKTEVHTRKLAQISAESDAQTKEWLLGKIQIYLPMFAAHFTGANALTDFLEGLDQKEFEKWISTFSENDVAKFEKLVTDAKTGYLAKRRLVESEKVPPRRRLTKGKNGKGSNGAKKKKKAPQRKAAPKKREGATA